MSIPAFAKNQLDYQSSLDRAKHVLSPRNSTKATNAKILVNNEKVKPIVLYAAIPTLTTLWIATW